MPTNNTDNVYTHEYEDTGAPIPGTKIGYDNSETGLEATNMQAAIDELDGKIKASDEASEISYDNTESELEATNVQAAIDELDGKIKASDEADEISYDNTDSGLVATNVQAALDEIAGELPSLEGYTLKSVDSVTLPNCTSYPSIVTSIKSDIESIIAGQPHDEKIMILGLNLAGFGWLSYYGSRALWSYDTATTYLTALFTRSRVEATSFLAESMGTSGCRRLTITDAAVTFKDFSVDEPTTTITAQLQIARFKPV